ncbi:type 2 periplasmic-binding domain-containing protein [Microbulbifer hainanensis]|uniref:hypothetical protein n=1 Tax=Microbulbifer hainanensis TaxID=2735675 RepID=UPI00186954C1|nr:hypothetical protein [Microbulbifer hainanensis]
MIRHDHPWVDEQLDLESYLALEHVHASSRRTGLGYVGLTRRKLGRERNIALLIPDAWRSSRWLRSRIWQRPCSIRWQKYYDVWTPELPFKVPMAEAFLYWHKSVEHDKASQWLT